MCTKNRYFVRHNLTMPPSGVPGMSEMGSKMGST